MDCLRFMDYGSVWIPGTFCYLCCLTGYTGCLHSQVGGSYHHHLPTHHHHHHHLVWIGCRIPAYYLGPHHLPTWVGHETHASACTCRLVGWGWSWFGFPTFTTCLPPPPPACYTTGSPPCLPPTYHTYRFAHQQHACHVCFMDTGLWISYHQFKQLLGWVAQARDHAEQVSPACLPPATPACLPPPAATTTPPTLRSVRFATPCARASLRIVLHLPATCTTTATTTNKLRSGCTSLVAGVVSYHHHHHHPLPGLPTCTCTPPPACLHLPLHHTTTTWVATCHHTHLPACLC